MSFSQFLRFAHAGCCNYTASGPFQKRHYCCLEPTHTQGRCLLADDLPCRWFHRAVVTAIHDKGLQENWRTELERWIAELEQKKAEYRLPTDPVPSDPVRTIRPIPTKLCACGLRFPVRSNRQQHCARCSEQRRKQSVREAVRRHAQKKHGLIL